MNLKLIDEWFKFISAGMRDSQPNNKKIRGNTKFVGNHNPAGTKLARMAASSQCATLRPSHIKFPND